MSNLATIVNNILADSGIDDINVIVSTGSYNNPSWITALSWTKITDAPSFITGTGTSGQVAYFNGTSTITGESNLFWDAANDRLGIGINIPLGRLHVASGNAHLNNYFTTGTSAGWDVKTYFTGGGSGSEIGLYLGYSGVDNDTYILRGSNGRLEFGTAATPRMVLNSSGNLGLGVTPSAWESGFNVFQFGNTGVLANNTSDLRVALNSNAFNNTSGIASYLANGFASQYNQISGTHRWLIAPNNTSGAGAAITFTQAMTLDASGRLLVGTPTAGTSNQGITVYSAGQGEIRLQSSGTGTGINNGFQVVVDGNTSYLWNLNNFPIVLGTNNTERMRITSGGNVGIGTTSPNGPLDVVVGASGARRLLINYDDSLVTIKSTAANAAPEILRLIGDGIRFNVGSSGSGTEAMRITSGGNVGIGTTNPTARLHVETTAGNSIINIISPNNSGAFSFYSNGTNLSEAYIGVNNATATLFGGIGGAYGTVIASYNSRPIAFGIDGSERMRITSGGLVGIGTNSPQALLHINSSVSHTFAYSTISGASPIALDNSSGALAIWTASTERMRITSGGNVGIGTTTPGARLDVNGSFNALTSGISLEYNNGILYHAGGSGNYYQYISGANYNIINRTATGALILGTSDTERMRITSGGDIAVGSPSTRLSGGSTNSTFLTLTAKASGANALLELNGTRTGNGDYSGYLRFFNNGGATPIADIQAIRGSSDTDGTLAFATSNTERMRITSGGNVGIGTNNPTQLLQVNGSNAGILLTGVVNTSGFRLSVREDGQDVQLISQGTGGGIRFLVNGSTEAARITNGGNVGIGTTSPSAKLEVSGAGYIVKATASGSDSSYFQAVNGSYDYIAGIATSLGYGLMGMNSNHPLVIMTNSTERMRITSGGNVGIGETNPTRKLDVLNSANAHIARFTGGASSNINIGIFASNALGFGSIGTQSNHGFNIYTNDIDRLYITSGGNVGIGTDNPDRLFHINGNTSTTTPLQKVQNIGTGDAVTEYRVTGASWYVGIDNSDADKFKIGQDPLGTSDRFTILDGGNVGIGTTNPGATLDVNGTIRTADLYGGTPVPWKLGKAYVGAPPTPTLTIEVEINGSIYQIGASTV